MADLRPVMEKYGVVAIVDQYHSGLEHTFLWVVETTESHNLEEFAIALGVACWNDLKFVPVRRTDAHQIHTEVTDDTPLASKYPC